MDDFGLLIGRYHASLPNLTDKELRELLLDSSGRVIISGRYLEDSAHSSGDAGLQILAVRKDTEGSLVDSDGDYAPLQVTADGRLKVDAKFEATFDYVYDEDSIHTSGSPGAFILAVRQDTLAPSTSADGDYAAFKVNEKGELYVKDSDVASKLDDIDTVLDNIYIEQLEQGTVLDSINTNISDIETELLEQGTVLDNIYAEQFEQGITLDNIDNNLSSLTKAEDSAHSSGDKGIMPLAVRADTDGSLVSSNGDYAPLQVNANGKLKVAGDIEIVPSGTEAYAVTDNLSVGGDGLVTITATNTPWVDVVSLSIDAGKTAYLYGYQWACDQNANARIITVEGDDIIVYRQSLNSSAMPEVNAHFSTEGRIEIAGATGKLLKLQIKKRQAPGGNATGSGALHVRIV